MADISAWSPVDESNNQPPPDGFPEGMAPSGLNNGMRAVMGAVRRWYDAVNANFGNFLPITGGTISGSLTVEDNEQVDGSLIVGGNEQVNGWLQVASYISSSTNITATGTVSGNAVVGNAVNSNGNITAAGDIGANDLGLTGSLVASGNITGNNVHANDTLSGVTLAVSGAATAASLSVSGNLNGYSLTVASNLSSGFLRSNAAHQAGTLMTHGGTNHVNFRWSGGSLLFRIDETVEHAIATTSLFAGLTDTVNALQARLEAMEEAAHAR